MKTSLLFFYSILLSLSLFFISCDNESVESSQGLNVSETELSDETLKKDFGRAFVEVLTESREVRALIKEEALKKINYDYDVLYLLVNDKPLGDGNTLEKLMLKYMDSEKLSLIKQRIPTLTIFVPELPLNSFSAELWNVDKDIPQVAIRSAESNDVMMIDPSKEEWVLEAKYIPTFPVVVIKENERISSNSSNAKILKSSSGASTTLAFIDKEFDNSNRESNDKATKSIVVGNYTVPATLEKVYNSYDIYSSYDGWQRDYIYYNLTPTQTKGAFKYNFQERLVGFELVGDPATGNGKGIIAKIADQTGDPRQVKDRDGDLTGWTDGEFEFAVKLYMGNIAGYGNESIKNFRAGGNQLFSPTYISNPQYTGRGSSAPRVIFSQLTCAWMSLSLPLFEWNLETVSPAVRIRIEESDPTQSFVNSEVTATKFATNFGFEPTIGETVKIGLKYGASVEQTTTVTYQVTTHQENDNLGDVVVNFGDDIILNKDIITHKLGGGGRGAADSNKSLNFNKKYSSGDYILYIAPVDTNIL